MKTFKLLFLVILCFVSITIFSQTKTANQKNYHYTFSGELSSQSKTELENSVMRLSQVTSSKIKYKPEQKAGELFFSVIEKPKTSEGDESGFKIIELKELILSFNITPLEFNSIEN